MTVESLISGKKNKSKQHDNKHRKYKKEHKKKQICIHVSFCEVFGMCMVINFKK